MGLLKKLFNFSKAQLQPDTEAEKSVALAQNLPETPLDEKFALNFIQNGGKFLYCDNVQEFNSNLINIINENNWQKEPILCFNERLKKTLHTFDIKLCEDHIHSGCFITTCEFLIADSGSVFFSSNQIKDKKITDYPENFIVLATTSQLTQSVNEAMVEVKRKYSKNIPTNITSLKNFNNNAGNDFMDYGSKSKKLYLLLLEDLT